MVCPNCGSSRVSFELRAAGTNAKTKYYRTGIKSSWIFPSGERSYKSQRLYKSIGICHNCGYYWERGSENQAKIDRIVIRCFVGLLYFGAWLGVLEGYKTANSGKVFIAFILIALTIVPFIKPIKKLIKRTRDRQKQPKYKPQTNTESAPEPRAQTNTEPTPAPCTQSFDKPPITQPIYARYANSYITDPKYIADPKELVIEAGKIAQEMGGLSTHTLQRCFLIGYIRASKILEYLEKQGVIEFSGIEKDRLHCSFRMTGAQFQQWVEAVKRNAPPEL